MKKRTRDIWTLVMLVLILALVVVHDEQVRVVFIVPVTLIWLLLANAKEES